MSKAFERIEYSILIDRLRKNHVPEFIINILCSIFSKSTARVYFNGSSSQIKLVTEEGNYRQGGVLSAYLFNVYIDSTLCRFSDFKIGCKLGLNKINIQPYADDMVLLSPTIQGLQFLIDEIYLDFNRLGLEVNTNKTVFMVFSNDKKVNSKSFKFHLDNILLKRVFITLSTSV